MQVIVTRVPVAVAMPGMVVTVVMFVRMRVSPMRVRVIVVVVVVRHEKTRSVRQENDIMARRSR